MREDRHFIVGALVGGVGAILPDIFLMFFGWRSEWLGEDHTLVKLHRFTHGRRGLVIIWLLGWTSHVIIDWLTHQTRP